MPHINVNLEGDGAWRDLLLDPNQKSGDPVFRDSVKVFIGDEAPSLHLALLKGGMTSGRHSIGIRIDLPDGTVLVTETSARALLAAADAIRTRIAMEGGE